ncbi:cerebellar degeneration-related protein 2-like isoform X2 [Ptychodera flava]|uniref:cerebellar degeneration-related protein 2-like isoform X2 n=1 Tax=Ptychodera flava TaxID=63121 RepID=UPI003969FF8F
MDDLNMDPKDLQLAAELGKTLLERNRELETSLIQAQHVNEEHTQHIMHLEKQLNLLRDASESKARLYEQLDYNIQEMEKTNQKLQHESRTDKQRIQRLTETVDTLETKIEEQTSRIEEMKLVERERARERRKAQSLPREMDLAKSRRYYSTTHLENQESRLQEETIQQKSTIRYLRSRLGAEKRKQDELEIELSVLYQENELLQEHIKKIQLKAEEEKNLEEEFAEAEYSSPRGCKHCHKLLTRSGDRSTFADSGASYESDDSDAIEWDTFVPVHTSPPQTQDGNKEEKKSASEISLFGELDAQYHDLMEKYNNLLQHSKQVSASEGAAAAGGTACKTVQTAPMQEKRRSLILDLAKMKDQEASQTEDSSSGKNSPEYKKLFKEIFEVLRKSKVQINNSGSKK